MSQECSNGWNVTHTLCVPPTYAQPTSLCPRIPAWFLWSASASLLEGCPMVAATCPTYVNVLLREALNNEWQMWGCKYFCPFALSKTSTKVIFEFLGRIKCSHAPRSPIIASFFFLTSLSTLCWHLCAFLINYGHQVLISGYCKGKYMAR